MHATRKGKQWYFRMKLHAGADVNSGLVHTVSVTPAHAPDPHYQEFFEVARRKFCI